MGAIVTVKTKYGNMDYMFDVANDGEDFKKDLEKAWKKDGIKNKKITIKKSKDVKPKPKPERKYHGW